MIHEASVAGKQHELLQDLHSALTSGREWLEDKDLSPEFYEMMKKDDYALKAFTDNIVIGWPIYGDAEGEFGAAFLKIGYFQLQMALHGFFLRGALSIGDAYVDEIVVIGQALTEAYDGENSLARDPRIILTKSAVETVKRHLQYYGDPKAAPQSQDVLCDTDGQWFINYLNCVFEEDMDGFPSYETIMKHKEVVQSKLVEFKGKPPIWSKYSWVARYHNFFCDMHSGYLDDEHKIDMRLYEQRPTIIS